MATISLEGRSIVVKASISDLEACRAIPGRQFVPARRVWIAPAISRVASKVLQLFPTAVIAPEVRTLAEDATREDAAANAVRLGPPPEVPHAVTRPWAHQARAWGFLMARRGTLLDMGMGTGKTKICIDACNSLLAEKDSLKVLVLAPTSVASVWPRQWRQHGSPAWEGRVVLVDDVGPIVKRTAVLHQIKTMPRHVVMVLGHGSASYGGSSGAALRDAVLTAPWDVVILDESHRAKSPKGNLAKLVAGLSHVPKRIALSGTPMPKDVLDIWAQAQFVEPGAFEGTFWAFRKRHAITQSIRGVPGAQKVIGFRDVERIRETMRGFSFSARTSDVLDLPPVLHERIDIKLSPDELRAYAAIDRDAVLKVKDNLITAANAAVEVMRLQQITGGSVTDEVGNTVRVGTAKKEALLDLLEDIGPDEPVVVFCRFQADLDQILEAGRQMGRDCRELSGRRNDISAEGGLWQSGNLVAAQVQAGSVGVDLTRARYAILWSLNYSLGDYEQLLARIHRPGQTRPCTYYHLVAKDTADEWIYEALQSKKEGLKAVLEALRERASVEHKSGK